MRTLQSLVPAAMIAAIAALVAPVAATAPQTAFLKAIPDVPLMQGLTEQPDPVVFESDRGRIVRTSAYGATVHDKPAMDFYAASLPALGWVRTTGGGADLAFRRGTEELKLETIEVIGAGPRGTTGTTVSFELVVKLASSKLPE